MLDKDFEEFVAEPQAQPALADDGEEAGDNADDATRHAFLKIIKVSSGKAKTLPMPVASACALRHLDLTVTLHSARNVDLSSHTCALSGPPKNPIFLQAALVVPITGLAQANCKGDIRRWSGPRDGVRHTIKNLEDCPDVGELVTSMVTQKCYPKSQHAYTPATDMQVRILQKLSMISHVIEDVSGGTWRLTSRGCQMLTHSLSLNCCRHICPVTHVLGVGVKPNKFECVLKLKVDGWRARRPWPTKNGMPP